MAERVVFTAHRESLAFFGQEKLLLIWVYSGLSYRSASICTMFLFKPGVFTIAGGMYPGRLTWDKILRRIKVFLQASPARRRMALSSAAFPPRSSRFLSATS